jgi:hypothetical protein
MFRRGLLLLALLGLLSVSAAPGQPKKPEPKPQPRITMLAPLGVMPGSTTKLTIRGLRLDAAKEVRFQEPGVVVKVLGKGKTGVPAMQDVNKVGDTQVEVEVKVPADFKAAFATSVVVTPDGESPPHRLLVDATPTAAEKEPNNSFRQAQPVQVPQVVEGRVSQERDVDVFRLEGKAGQQLVLEVLAARHGSALDSLLTLYDAEGQTVAVSDDIEGSSDSRIEVTLPRTGVYYLSLIDANDQGGPGHVYRLSIRAK